MQRGLQLANAKDSYTRGHKSVFNHGHSEGLI